MKTRIFWKSKYEEMTFFRFFMTKNIWSHDSKQQPSPQLVVININWPVSVIITFKALVKLHIQLNQENLYRMSQEYGTSLNCLPIRSPIMLLYQKIE